MFTASCQRILPLGEQWGVDCWSLQKPPNLAESLCPPSLLKNYPQLLSRESLCWVLGIRDRIHRLALGSWKYSCPGPGRDCNSSCLLLIMYLLTLRGATPGGPAQACSQLSTLALLPGFRVVPRLNWALQSQAWAWQLNLSGLDLILQHFYPHWTSLKYPKNPNAKFSWTIF